MPVLPELDIRFTWNFPDLRERHRYKCAWCGHLVSSQLGLSASGNYLREFHALTGFQVSTQAHIAVCPDCTRPTYFEVDTREEGVSVQLPDAPLGLTVQHLPSEIAALYDEARHCTTVSAFTSAVLLTRKILLHVAVKEGAPQNSSFLQAVNYLDEHHYIPRNGKGWVDRIRRLGNEANHEIVLMTREQAEEALTFTGWLLTLTYQLPGSLPPPAPSTP